jgi:hypothetical protein
MIIEEILSKVSMKAPTLLLAIEYSTAYPEQNKYCNSK